MATFFDEFLDLDAFLAQKDRNWPSLKQTLDVLRAFPMLAIFATGLGLIYKAGDYLDFIFWILAPIVTLLTIGTIFQTSVLLIVILMGLLSYIPGAEPAILAAREKHPEIIKSTAAALAFLLTFIFTISIIWTSLFLIGMGLV